MPHNVCVEGGYKTAWLRPAWNGKGPPPPSTFKALQDVALASLLAGADVHRWPVHAQPPDSQTPIASRPSTPLAGVAL